MGYFYTPCTNWDGSLLVIAVKRSGTAFMFKDAKYIIIDCSIYGEYPIIGPNFLNHSDLHIAAGQKTVAAGFFSIDGDKVSCFGESVSLDVKSRGEEDARLLRKLFRIGEFNS